MQKRVIDLETYARRAHFEHFCAMQNPHVGVTVQVDVTELVRVSKEKKCSFFLLFLHAAALAADAVPQLRQRIQGGSIVEYDQCSTSHIELLEDETYCYCTLHHDKPLGVYLRDAEERRVLARQNASLDEHDEVDGQFFISCVPWLHYTDLTQPTSQERSNPSITWGRWEEDWKGRLRMPVTLMAHHALVDGVHLAQFYRNLDRELERVCTQAEGLREEHR